MRHITVRHMLVLAALITIAAAAALWSWNTLAVLFGAPEAGIQHLLAAAMLTLLARTVFSSRHGRRRHAFSSRSR